MRTTSNSPRLERRQDARRRRRGLKVVALALEQQAQRLQHVGLIVGDQDPWRGAAGVRAANVRHGVGVGVEHGRKPLNPPGDGLPGGGTRPVGPPSARPARGRCRETRQSPANQPKPLLMMRQNGVCGNGPGGSGRRRCPLAVSCDPSSGQMGRVSTARGRRRRRAPPDHPGKERRRRPQLSFLWISNPLSSISCSICRLPSSSTTRPSKRWMVVGVAGVARVVGDHADRRALVVQLAQQLHHGVAVLRVEVPGGLVGQQDRRVAPEGARHGHALLLAARELAGKCLARCAMPTRASASFTRSLRSAPVMPR